MGEHTHTQISEESHQPDFGLTQQEMAYYAVIEQVAKLQNAHMRKTRNLHRFKATDVAKVSDLKLVPKSVRIKTMTINDIESVIGNELKLVAKENYEFTVSPMGILAAASTNNTLKHMLEAVVSIRATQEKEVAQAVKEHKHLETARNLELTREAYTAFGLNADDNIEYIEVSQDDYRLTSFDDSEDTYEIGCMKPLGIKLRIYQNELDMDNQTNFKGGVLNMNHQTIKNMMFDAPAYYCPACKTSYGANQVRNNICSHSKASMNPSSVTLKLPLIQNGKLAVSSVGKVEFRTIRCTAEMRDAILAARSGKGTAAAAIDSIMTNPKMRFKGQWPSADVRPVVFDVLGCSRPYIGLAVSLKKITSGY